MVDLHGKDKGNISLPLRLQSPDIGDGKPLKEEDEPKILNMQVAMYDIHIEILKKRIKRLKTRNQELEDFCNRGKDDMSSQNLETEKKIVQLNNSIAAETKKVDEAKRKCNEVEKSRKVLKQNHLNIVGEMEEKFIKTKKNFRAKIQSINAKVNSIEDYKLAEENLRIKYNNQEKSLLQAEQELEESINQIEFRAKIHKENLKKEAYKKVLEASEQFQSDLKVTVPIKVQRLMRENIVLENELAILWNDYANMEETISNYINYMQQHNKQIKDAKMNKRRRLITIKIYKLLLNKLRNAHRAVKKELLKKFKPPADFENQYFNQSGIAEDTEFLNSDYQRRKLEIILHCERIDLSLANNLKLKTQSILHNICEGLNILKSAVNSAVLVSDTNDDLKNLDLQTFSFYVLSIIENCNLGKLIPETESIETIPQASNIYAKGDLGFEPKHIDIRSLIELEIKKLSPKSTESALATVKEAQKLLEDKHSSSEKDSISADISIISKSLEKDDEERERKRIVEDFLDYGEYETEFDLEEEFDEFREYK